MKKHLILFTSLFITIVALQFSAFAKTEYIYRSRANWVKIVKLSKKQLAGHTLMHPYTSLTNSDVENMLQSISINQASLFKKEIKEKEIFNAVEAKKYAPFILEGLKKISSNEILNVSIVHKRPYFVLRNDYLTNINIYITNQGIHFYFNKIYAKLYGDYKQASQMNEAIRKAKSLRLTLKANPGQKLSVKNGIELIMDLGHNFSDNVAEIQNKNDEDNKEILKSKSDRKKKNKVYTKEDVAPSTSSSSESLTIKQRLQKLEELKKSKLISDSEYKIKRKEILDDL